MYRRLWILPVLSMACAAACAASTDAPVEETGTTAAPLSVPPGLALRIAVAGHGRAFDASGKEISFTLPLIEEMHASIKAEVLEAIGGKMTPATAELMKEVDTWLAKEPLKLEDRRLLEGAAIWRLLQEAPVKLKQLYEWRVEVLNAQIDPRYQAGNWITEPRLRDLLRRIGYLDLSRFRPTDYMKRCSEQGVPVPPNWAETGTAWQLQGNLTSNLLAPGAAAAVWTYEATDRRGACIALPRGDGGPGSLAGIICQSATTGAACFWDNKLREPMTGEPLAWGGRTLEINQLLDGSNLVERCTDCHRGNNVYLISPEDPTWQRLLRVLPHEAGSRFTTNVETSSDNRGGHPRYVPITTAAGRPGWLNEYSSTPGCAGSCHEQPAGGFAVPSPMPPACSTDCYSPL